MVDVRATSLFTGSIALVSRKWSAPLMTIGLYNEPARAYLPSMLN